jgi:hypothetical protein
MKNLIQKIGKFALPLVLASGISGMSYGQSNPNSVAWAEEGKAPVAIESQEAFDYLAKADDVLHGLPVNKFINYSNGKKSVTYNAPGQLDRSKIPDWNGELQELADMADQYGNSDGKVSKKEAENLCWDTYDWSYKNSNSVQWAQ